MSRTRTWTHEDIPDQSGRIAVVTGASSGIGQEAARQLARKGATVIVAVRNAEKGEAAVSAIRREQPTATVRHMALDLASLSSVRAFATAYGADYDRLDLLINNAGVMMPPYSRTEDGFELQMGTNHMGHFALTGLLYERLRATPGSRVVTVSSGAHAWGDLDFEDLDWRARDYSPQRAYGDSKLANLYFTYELGRRRGSGADGPLATAAHPGWTATDLQRHSGLFRGLNYIFAQGVEMGALPTLRAATDEDAPAGAYYGPRGFLSMRGYPEIQDSNELSQDREIAARLWAVSEARTGVRFPLEAAEATATMPRMAREEAPPPVGGQPSQAAVVNTTWKGMQ